MDPFSHVLALLRPQAVDWRVIDAPEGWTLRFHPSPDVVVFGQAIDGPFEIVRDDGRRVQTSSGDFLLMASPGPWALHRPGDGPSIDFKAFLDAPASFAGGAAQSVTRFIGGHFTFAAAGAELLGKLMLPIVHVRAAEVQAGRLGALLALLGDEALAGRPGGAEVMARLLEVLLVESLRHPGAGWDQAGSGLLNGLADPRIGQALRLMHDDVRRVWTVGELAKAAGMSRSAFAGRFADVVGLPPMEYLSSWRMTLARQALLADQTPMADIAELAGYRSVSAFSTAFRRLTGASPSRYLQSSSAGPVQ
jgi:AraC-like DNA-binding protein